jgi:hypothetical protein
MEKSSSLITDSVTLQSLRDFLISEKPSSITPVDVLHVVHLITRKAEDHQIYDSQQTLARAFACDVKTVVRSQKRLEKLRWLSRPQRRGRTNALSLNYENIPSEKSVRTLVTQNARHLSARYQNDLRRMGLKKKFPKTWLERQFLSAQRILDKCDGDVDLAARIIGHALNNPRHRNKSKKSLYEVLGQWHKVKHSYDAEHPEHQAAEQANQPVQQPVQAAKTGSEPTPTPLRPSQPMLAYTIRNTVHPGIGLRWNARTNQVEYLASGELAGDGEVHRRIIPAGLKRHLVTGEFVRASTYEPIPLDELQERLMGSEAWQRERLKEEAQ